MNAPASNLAIVADDTRIPSAAILHSAEEAMADLWDLSDAELVAAEPRILAIGRMLRSIESRIKGVTVLPLESGGTECLIGLIQRCATVPELEETATNKTFSYRCNGLSKAAYAKVIKSYRARKAALSQQVTA